MVRKLAAVCIGVLLIASVSVPAMAQTTTCDETQIRTSLQRVIDEGFNQGSTGVIDEVFADSYVDHPGETSRDDFKSQIEQIRTAIPSGQATVDHVLVQGCDAFFNFVDSGVMEGALGEGANALPATNQPLTLQNHVYLHFDDTGKVVEEWDYNDNLPFMMQLGLFPTQQPSADGTPEVTTPVAADEPITPSGNEAANTALLQQIYDQNFNAGDLDAMRALFSTDYISYNSDNTTTSLDDFFGTLTALRGAMPDLKITINGSVAEGDYVATRVTLAGTFANELTFPGAPAFQPTNQPFSIEMSFLDRVSDGLIVEDWTLYDQVSFLSQLGLMNNSEGTPETTPQAGS